MVGLPIYHLYIFQELKLTSNYSIRNREHNRVKAFYTISLLRVLQEELQDFWEHDLELFHTYFQSQ